MPIYASLSFANPQPHGMTATQKAASASIAVGLLIFAVAWAGAKLPQAGLLLLLALGLLVGGGGVYAHTRYANQPAGIHNNGVWHKNLTRRGTLAWMLGIVLTGFYVCLYWFPETLSGLVALFDPFSLLLRQRPADQWFVYGSFYTVAVLLLGFKFAYKYRHNRYQLIRTISVCFFQLIFSFLIPALLQVLNEPEYYFTYFWPLKREYFFPQDLDNLILSPGKLGIFMAFWGIMMSFIAVPVLTYFFGKRWYCSWVCGCGGLAETAGDSFRHLSDKSLKAWQWERYVVHGVLVFITLTTILLWANAHLHGELLGSASRGFSKTYGFLIGSMFSGVIGTGFYPIFGSRVWCRFGCPQAAILGIIQKYFSRFRITVNGGQCISCGNCSTYCEMGIDVKAYAQRGQDIVRASCVGCGICAAVCPRGVLRLENGSADVLQRTSAVRTIHVRADEVTILR